MRGETPEFETFDFETPDCEATRRIGGSGRPLPRQRSKPLNIGVERGPTSAAATEENARPVRLPN